MEIRRISKYSKIVPCVDYQFFEDEKVIQVVTDEKNIYVEYIPKEYLEAYMQDGVKPKTSEDALFADEPQKTTEQMELENALDTQLINDPLGRYNGCNLRVPFDRGDKEWVDWVIDNMHNKFIKDKVILIRNSGYGTKN